MDNLFSVAERFGTPCFVFDEVQLARRMKAVRAIVPEDIRLCYSIKANPFLIPAMRRLVYAAPASWKSAVSRAFPPTWCSFPA